MFIKTKICLNLIIILPVVLAWLPPERCKQSRNMKRFNSSIYLDSSFESASTVSDIKGIAINQNKNLKELYKNAKFIFVPKEGFIRGCQGCSYEMYAPNSCTFYTYNPRILSSVYCNEGVTCKLGHTVSTVESYTASEGYNWGVKVSAKASFFKIFEVGGEVSTGGSYSCTYTKSKTKSDNVECSVSSVGGKTLQLYNVQSDMKCQFSNITMVPDKRNGTTSAYAPGRHTTPACMDPKPSEKCYYNYFTQDEMRIIRNHGIIKSSYGFVLLDFEKIPDKLLQKIKGEFPDYNPYTDLIRISRVVIHPQVMYYKASHVSKGYKKVIPFTNEAGDSIYQYACVLT